MSTSRKRNVKKSQTNDSKKHEKYDKGCVTDPQTHDSNPSAP